MEKLRKTFRISAAAVLWNDPGSPPLVIVGSGGPLMALARMFVAKVCRCPKSQLQCKRSSKRK